MCSGKVQPDDVQDRDEKFACGTHFIRAVSAPGTGKTTALRNIWGYVHDSFLKLVALLPLAPDDSRLVQLHERVKNCLSPKCFLSFTFSNEGRLQLSETGLTCMHVGWWLATHCWPDLSAALTCSGYVLRCGSCWCVCWTRAGFPSV